MISTFWTWLKNFFGVETGLPKAELNELQSEKPAAVVLTTSLNLNAAKHQALPWSRVRASVLSSTKNESHTN